jgi:hypothetical protein
LPRAVISLTGTGSGIVSPLLLSGICIGVPCLNATSKPPGRRSRPFTSVNC